MEPEHKSRSKKMTIEQVRRLIAARVECNYLFTKKFYDKKDAWRNIKERAELHDFTADQVKVKWSNLTTKYKSLIIPPTGGATENGKQTPDDWEHFGQMHNFMSTQHTINPPIVVNSCGITVENSNNPSCGLQNTQDDDTFETGLYTEPSLSTPESSSFSSPEPTSPVPRQDNSEGQAGRNKRKRNRYTQQDMFEHFVLESKRKKKEGEKFFTLLKCFAEAQNITLPNFDSSASDSD